VSKKDKIGVAVIIGIVVFLIVAMLIMSRGDFGNRGWTNNRLVEQRLINIRKSK
jgi:hypothetical protein